MSYAALPDMRMPYDNDGTVVYWWGDDIGAAVVVSGSDAAEMNDKDETLVAHSGQTNGYAGLCFFFPEQREITGLYALLADTGTGSLLPVVLCKGSNDTTNGLDGTWETAVAPQGYAVAAASVDQWRHDIRALSFTGAKRAVVIARDVTGSGGGHQAGAHIAHLYGEKAAGETVDDILFLDGDTSYAEYEAPEDFGDRPLGTTLTRTFKVKNSSATLTAGTINLQCNHANFIISTDGTTWVTTINIASLAPGASSGVLYVRNTTPDPGAPLGPDFARIVCTVGSWT